jgi:hypothetical protein
MKCLKNPFLTYWPKSGESGVKLIVLHLELGDYVGDPGEFHKDLYAIFKENAIILEKAIVKQLFQRLIMPYPARDEFDFRSCVNQAGELFTARQKGL